MDDPTIKDDWMLYRRIVSDWFVPDPKTPSGRRITSQAFNDSSDGTSMSIQIEQEMENFGLTIEDILKNYPDLGLASFSAGFARSQKQGVIRKPLDMDPAHGEVVGEKPRSIRRIFAENANIIIEPKIQ
ncbi:MAG: hypothetical protein V3S64_13570 [bacterium]